MRRFEEVVAKATKKITEFNVNQSACFFWLYQPAISEKIRKRLKEKT